MPDAPFWDRLAGIGAPTSVSGAAPPLHPLTWLARFLPEASQTPAVSFAAALIAAALIYVFVRREGSGGARALTAAILTGGVLAALPAAGLLGLAVVSVMLAVDWFADDPSRRRWAAVVAVAAMAFLGAGHIELTAVFLAAGLAAAVARQGDVDAERRPRSATVVGAIAAVSVGALLAAPGFLPASGIRPEELPVLAQYPSHWPLTLFAVVPLAVLLRREASSGGLVRLATAGALALLLFGIITTAAGPIVLSAVALALAIGRMAVRRAIVLAAGSVAGAFFFAALAAAEQPCAVRTELRGGSTLRIIDSSATSLNCVSGRVGAVLHRARAGERWVLDSPALDAAGIAFVDSARNDGVFPAVYLAPRFRLTSGGPPEAEALDRDSALVDHIPPKIARLASPRLDRVAPRQEFAADGGKLDVLQHGDGLTRVQVRSNGWNLLVTNEPAWSGWRAYWNGERLPPVVVNQAFVGSFVPPGEGLLVLRYKPDEFDIGLRIAAMGLLIGVFTFAVPWYLLVPPLPRIPLPAAARFRFPAGWLRLSRRTAVVVGTLLLAGYLAMLTVHFADIAGGSDSSGYLNFSRLWQRGDLSVPVRFPMESGLPPEMTPAFVPLGFVLGTQPYTMVPSYPPGLPLMIAGTRSIAGDAIAFRVPAILSAAGILFMYFLGRAFGLSRGWSAAGAAILAVFPTYIFMAIQPMTDSIAAALAAGAVLFALRSREHAGWAILAGALVGIGVMVRPTQVLLFPATLLALQLRPRALIALGFGGLPFAIAQMAISETLYGNPLSTGYGGIGYLLSLDGFIVRFKHYSYWLAVFGTPLLFPGGLAILLSRTIDWWTRGVLTFWFGCFFLFYTFYAPYETWWYTRFLLPALPALIIGMLLALRALSIRAAPRWRVVAPLLAGFVVASGVFHTIERDVLAFEEHDRIYVRAISGAERHMPDDAMLVAMQFSGALRYYAGRSIVRWDGVDPQTFATIRRAAGSRPWFALLSDFEIEDAFRNVPGEWEEVERYGSAVLFRLRVSSSNGQSKDSPTSS